MSEHKILFSVLNQSGSHKDNNFFYQWRQRRQYVRMTPWREDRASPSRLKRNREREIAVETIFFALFRRAEVSAWQERRAIHAREKWCLYARKIIPTVPAVIYERGCPVDKRPHRVFFGRINHWEVLSEEPKPLFTTWFTFQYHLHERLTLY